MKRSKWSVCCPSLVTSTILLMWLFQMLLFDKWKKYEKIANIHCQCKFVLFLLFPTISSFTYFFSILCFIFFHHFFFFIYSLFFLKKNLLIATPFYDVAFQPAKTQLNTTGERKERRLYTHLFLLERDFKKKNSSSVQSISDRVFLSWESLLQNTTVEMMVAQVR